MTSLTDSQGNTLFDTGNRKYISVNGIEARQITAVNTGTKTLTLNADLVQNPKLNAYGFRPEGCQLSA